MLSRTAKPAPAVWPRKPVQRQFEGDDVATAQAPVPGRVDIPVAGVRDHVVRDDVVARCGACVAADVDPGHVAVDEIPGDARALRVRPERDAVAECVEDHVVDHVGPDRGGDVDPRRVEVAPTRSGAIVDAVGLDDDAVHAVEQHTRKVAVAIAAADVVPYDPGAVHLDEHGGPASSAADDPEPRNGGAPRAGGEDDPAENRGATAARPQGRTPAEEDALAKHRAAREAARPTRRQGAQQPRNGAEGRLGAAARRSLPCSDAQREQAAEAVGDADSAAAASRTRSTLRLAIADDHDGSRGCWRWTPRRGLRAGRRPAGPRDGPRPDNCPWGRAGAANGRQLGKRLRFRELRQREARIRDGDRGQRRCRGGLVGARRSTGGEGGEEAERAHENCGRRARRHTSDRAGPLDQGVSMMRVITPFAVEVTASRSMQTPAHDRLTRLLHRSRFD